MSRNISILATMTDRISPSIKSIQSGFQTLSKDSDETRNKLTALESKQGSLIKMQAQLKTSLVEASQKVKDATKAFKENNDEVSRLSLDKANEEYLRLTKTASEYRDEMKRTTAEARSLQAEQSKLGSRAEGGLSSRLKGDVAGQLLTAGVGKLLSDSLSSAAGTFITSSLGTPAGDAVASIISGAVTGGIMGSVVPGIGTAIGTVVGGSAGLINAGTQMYQAEDDAFKSTRGDMISEQQTRLQGDTQAGIGIASGRQLDQISFSTMFKDEDRAKEYLSWVKDTANTTPFLYDDLKAMSKTLATYGYSPEEMKGELLNIGDTGAALGMNNQDMSMVATGLGRMRSSGKTTLEYLNLLVERGIPAIDYLGESLGVSTSEVYDMVSKGLIPGADAARAIADAMGEANAGAMEAMSKTFSGLSSNVEGLEQERQNARGEGFVEEREKGLRLQAAYLQSDPELISKSERLIGQWEASLENDRERLLRKHENEAYLQINQEGLVGAEAGRALAEARIAAEAEYNASKGAQLKLESELALTENVTEMLAENPRFWNANYELGKAASKGMAAGITDTLFGLNEEALGIAKDFGTSGRRLTRDEFNQMYGMMATDEAWGTYSRPNDAYEQLPPAMAYGLSYVPYNDFPARLHEGERVLTASEARGYKNGGGVTVTVTGNEFVIREDADIDRIATEIVRKLQEVQMVS